MLLKEFLEISAKSEYELLLEDLGSLKIVDPKFRDMLKVTGEYKSSGTPGKLGRYTSVLSKRLGKDSPIKTKVLKSAADAVRALEEDKSAVAFTVIDKRSGDQVFFAIRNGEKSGGYNYGVDVQSLLSELDPETSATMKKRLLDAKIDISDFKSKDRNDTFRGKVVPNRGERSSALYKVLTTVIKALDRKLGPEITVIYGDNARLKKQDERKTARQGMIPISDVMSRQFNNDARAALRQRLDKFKASKAKRIDSPEDLIEAIMQEGYLDKIKIGDFDYKLSNDHIRLDYLKSKDKRNRAYVTYELDRSTDKYSSARRAAFAAMAKDDKDMDKVAEQLPPGKITVYLGLEGGTIAPTDVEVSPSFW